MKKILTAAVLLNIFAAAVANTASAVTLPDQEAKQPKMAFGVYEQTKTGLKPANQTVLSRTDGKTRLCWAAYDLPLQPSANIVEHIASPSAAVFNDPQGRSERTHNGLQHHIYFDRILLDGTVSRCWQFSKTDPIGEYKMQIEVGKIQFPAYTFTVTE